MYKNIHPTGILLYVNDQGALDVADTSLAHLKGIQPQITTRTTSITAVNILANPINIDLDMETQFTNTGKSLYSNTGGNLYTSYMTVDYINGIQTQLDTINNTLSQETREIKASTASFHCVNTEDKTNTNEATTIKCFWYNIRWPTPRT